MRRLTSVTWGICTLAILTCASGSESNATEGGHLELLVATHNDVQFIDMEISRVITIASGLRGATAVDFDVEHQLVVWSDVSAHIISKANIETGEISVIAKEGIATPDGIALDWIHGYVYWTDTGTDSISVVTLDGNIRKSVIETDLREPRAIVLDPVEGWMFWTDWGSQRIERAGMDGTHRSVIVSSGLGWPNGLSIEFDSRKLYWADARADKICSSDYDGSNIKVILADRDELAHPFAIDVYEDWMYWTDWHKNKVFKAKKFTGENLQFVWQSSNSPMGIRVFHDSKQPKGINYCEEFAECSHLCLPSPRITTDSKNFTCACPDGMKLSDNERNCTLIPTTTTVAPSTTIIPCPYDPSFTCANGRCVRTSWICDGDNDCRDNSDEQNCDAHELSTIAETVTYTTMGEIFCQFTCANGRCVKEAWVCDGDNDCRDNSDEQNCEKSTTTSTSSLPHTTTRKSTTTSTSPVPHTTTSACPDTTFRCDNDRCIRRGFVCDHDDDCGDGSDERNCEFHLDTTEHLVHTETYPDTETAETVPYVLFTIGPFRITSSIPHNTNDTMKRIQEGIGTGGIAGMVFGILVGLMIVVIVVGFFMHKRRNHSMTNFENPVYRKESEVPLRLESKSTKESVILPL